MILRRPPAAFGGREQQVQRAVPVLLEESAGADEDRKGTGRLAAAEPGGIGQEARAVGGEMRGPVADQQPFAETSHRLDIAALGRPREHVDRIVVPAARIVVVRQDDFVNEI